MIIQFLLKRRYLSNLFVWWYLIEYHTISWILEYEIERSKWVFFARRVISWLRPYKVFSRHINGIMESIPYAKMGAILFIFKDFVFHTSGRFYTRMLLLFNNCHHFSKNVLFLNMLRFVKYTVAFVNGTFMWFRDVESLTKSNTFSTHFGRNLLSATGFYRSWIFNDFDHRNIIYGYELIILDAKRTFFEWIRVLRNTFFKNRLFKKCFFLNFQIFYYIGVFLFSICLFKCFFYFSIFKNSWLYLVFVLFLYFFITTYFHFSKVYSVNKYTSQNQRFWKRTFGVFWGLEFTLFFIYMYLTLISPAELPSYGTNYKEIITGLNVVQNSKYHLFYFLVLLFLNFSYVILYFLKKKNNFHFFYVILFATNLMYCYVIYYEFYKLYYVAGWGTHTVHSTSRSLINPFEYNNLFFENNLISQKSAYFKVPNSTINTWNEVSNEKQWVRTFRHFVYITILLKFWHIFLIYFYFGLSLVKFIETGYMSFDVVSTNHQNTIYVIWFYLFSYLLILKKKIYFVITFVYYWSFIHVNFVDLVYYFFSEFNFLYLI